MGRDRHEYLYDMMYWEIYLIQRGYRHRNVLLYQLQRLTAYGSFFCMSGTDKSPQDWLKLYFDQYKAPEGISKLTNEDRDDLVAEIEAENKRLAEQRQAENQSLPNNSETVT